MSHMGELEYTPKTLASLLGTIKIIPDEKVLGDKIIVMNGYRKKVSVWDLTTGELWGECTMEDATEFYMSYDRYYSLLELIKTLS